MSLGCEQLPTYLWPQLPQFVQFSSSCLSPLCCEWGTSGAPVRSPVSCLQLIELCTSTLPGLLFPNSRGCEWVPSLAHCPRVTQLWMSEYPHWPPLPTFHPDPYVSEYSLWPLPTFHPSVSKYPLWPPLPTFHPDPSVSEYPLWPSLPTFHPSVSEYHLWPPLPKAVSECPPWPQFTPLQVDSALNEYPLSSLPSSASCE